MRALVHSMQHAFMSEPINPQAKVVKALHSSSKAQTHSTDPRLKIEAANWQLFFELPLWKLLKLRDDAVSLPAPVVKADELDLNASDDELPQAVNFSKQPAPAEGSAR